MQNFRNKIKTLETYRSIALVHLIIFSEYLLKQNFTYIGGKEWQICIMTCLAPFVKDLRNANKFLLYYSIMRIPAAWYMSTLCNF
jgi:hypothetical protein